MQKIEITEYCDIHGELREGQFRWEKNGKYNKFQCIQCKKDFDLKRKWGLSRQEYEDMLSSQNNKCAICGLESTTRARNGSIVPLAIDHCHSCNKIRKLLCQKCNTGIGKAKESIEILQSAISYLQSHEHKSDSQEAGNKAMTKYAEAIKNLSNR
jgi:hypothetical protein